MKFIIDNNKKIILGWSAKCGCSHIKKIFYNLQNVDEKLHTSRDNNKLPEDTSNYIIILVVRNPFERIISGYLDKYKLNGQYRKLWKYKNITFNMFVNELIKNDYKMIDKHHFTPQTSEYFDLDKILNSKKLYIFDINNIDYNILTNLYNKKIEKKLLDFRGGHQRKATKKIDKNVYDLDMKEYINYKIDTKYFYNDELQKLVYNFYYDDFKFFEKYTGFNYHILYN